MDEIYDDVTKSEIIQMTADFNAIGHKVYEFKQNNLLNVLNVQTAT